MMDSLIKALEARGFSVAITTDRGPRTLVKIDGESFQVGIDEKVRRSAHEPTPEERRRNRYSWLLPQYDYSATGVMVLCIRNAPYGVRRQWGDGKTKKMEDRLGAVLRGLRIAAQREKELAIKRERQHRIWEEQRRRYDEQERLRRLQEKRIEKLASDVERWHQACRIQRYIEALEGISQDVDGLAEWISWAKQYADLIDPLRQPHSIVLVPGDM